MKLLQLEGLTLSYGDQRVLNDLSFGFDQGKITGLLGPNGAGKSSIMKILAGLVRPDSGSCRMGDKPVLNFADLRKRCSYMIDSPAFYPYLSGIQNLELINRILGKSTNLSHLMERVGLDASSPKPIKNYSTGMKQRLAIAQVMLRDAELLILDEPFNGLDPNGFQELMTLLREIVQSGKTVVVSSHLLNELEQFADCFILLHHGNIAMNIKKDELLKSKKKVVYTFQKPINKEAEAFILKKGRLIPGELRAVLQLNPSEIAGVVERLVEMNMVPINVETQNILQEKYLEITA